MPTFGLIFAIDSEYGFSKAGTIPWKCPEDMAHFKMITSNPSNNSSKNANIVMGKKTFQSIGRELPNRRNIVMSSNFDIDNPLPNQCQNFEELFQLLGDEFAWVIGGISLFEQLIVGYSSLIKKGFITIVNGDYKCDQLISRKILNFFNCTNIDGKYYCFSPIDITLTPTVRIEYHNFSFADRSKFSKLDTDYLEVMEQILTKPLRMTRNGATRSMFGVTLRCNDISERFPILQSKKVFWKGIVEELLFFLSGLTDTKLLESRGINIWKGNTNRDFLDSHGFSDYKDGEMGPMYGYQLRHFNAKYTKTDESFKIDGKWDLMKEDITPSGIDQLREVVQLLVNDPYSRRILMTTYNPAQAKEGVLYPCHGIVTQFYVDNDSEGRYRISLSTYQRSADWFLGVPFNISSYGLLLYIIVQEANELLLLKGSDVRYIPGDIVFNFGDVHLYASHLEPALEQLTRSCLPLPAPRLTMQPVLGLLAKTGRELWDEYSTKDFVLEYESMGVIKAEMVA